jgi:hypothetical protein
MKRVKIIGRFFIVVGVFLLVGGYFSYKHTRHFIANSTIASGKVIDLVLQTKSDSDSPRTNRGTYHPVIRYETESREAIEFVSHTGSNPPSNRRGDRVTVRYDPNDPYKARVDSFISLWLSSLIPSGLGILFLTAGGIMTRITIRSAGIMKYLEDFGRDISTEFQSVSVDASVTVNSRHPYRIFSQWYDPTQNKMLAFKSKAIWFNPEKHIQSKDIRVRIDPNNPQRYVMDTSFLPEAE